MKKKLFALSIVFLCTSLTMIFATPGISFSVNSIKTNGDIIAGIPIPTGADIGLEIPLGSSLYSVTFRAAGGYESRMILRNPITSVPIMAPSAIDNTNRFFWTNAMAEIGVRRYLVREDDGGKNIWLFGLARGRYEDNATSFPTTVFADAQGMQSISAMLGIAHDSTFWQEPNRKVGWYAEFSMEYSPTFANFTTAQMDFGRFNLTTEGFIPLTPEAGTLRNPSMMAPYIVLYGVGDYAVGSHIPHEILTTYGGIKGTKGLGDMVRGAQPWGYEAPIKGYASVELRFPDQSILENFALYPVGYVFGDIGAYGGLYDKPLGASFFDNSGIIASAGAGVSLSVQNYLWLGAYAGWRWPITDPLASTYYSKPSGFFWGITFAAHY